jgi:NAD(P)-dependent dehydrogenase (short-subunit alcohol dehydrogenase family)/carbon monoxide dehydrogenase subunit G
MIKLKEVISVNRQPNEIFDYVKNFASCQEWDSTAIEAVKTSDGPIDVGTTFRVVCALPLGSLTLKYTIEHLEQDRIIVLTGVGRFFNVVDTITLSPDGEGTRLTYEAVFSFKGLLSTLAPSMEAGLTRMGRESIQVGLKQALDDDYTVPTRSSRSAFTSSLVVPALADFSRIGYRRGQKRWNPISASLVGKHVLITGATAGLGLATARKLAEMGAALTLVVRDREKGAALLRELETETGNNALHLEIADLSLMADVDKLVARLKKRARQFDVCINNAGALFNSFELTSEGLERSFALLLLSPYRLMHGIKSLLGEGSRVINVVSGGMYSQRLDVDAMLHADDGYRGAAAYAMAKRGFVVVTEAWSQNWAEDGIVVNSMHPGWADTPGVESSLPAFHRITRPILRTPAEGADTIVWLASATEAGRVSGKLFLDREPQSTHLVNATREGERERRRLLDLLGILAACRPKGLADVAGEIVERAA